MIISAARIALNDALHVKGAEFWLKLGEPMEALRELDLLPRRARRHPWAIKTFITAFGVLRGPDFYKSLYEGEATTPLPAVKTGRELLKVKG